MTFNESRHELLVFYKRNDNVLITQEFWNSQLPHFHLQGILDSDLKVTFLQLYFSSNGNCNHELNKHLVAIIKTDFIKHFKLWEAFNKLNFFDSLKEPPCAPEQRRTSVLRQQRAASASRQAKGISRAG